VLYSDDIIPISKTLAQPTHNNFMQVQSSNKPKQLKTQVLNDTEEEDSKE